MTRQIAFRPDAGEGAGLGHVRRCVSLAIALRECGLESIFEMAGGAEPVRAAGFAIGSAAEPCAYVVDSYTLCAEEWEALRGRGRKLIVIDDLAQNPVEADLVINPGIATESLAYPAARSTALGIEYALMRPEFAAPPQRTAAAHTPRLLVTVGGSDPHDLTPRLVAAFASKGFDAIDVIVGPFFENREAIARVAGGNARVALHSDPPDIRSLMLRADVALTGGGQTLCEIAATATPAVAIEIALNQRRNLYGFSSAGALVLAGTADDPEIVEKAERAVEELAEDAARRFELGQRGRALVDGRGAARAAARIVAEIGVEA